MNRSTKGKFLQCACGAHFGQYNVTVKYTELFNLTHISYYHNTDEFKGWCAVVIDQITFLVFQKGHDRKFTKNIRKQLKYF